MTPRPRHPSAAGRGRAADRPVSGANERRQTSGAVAAAAASQPDERTDAQRRLASVGDGLGLGLTGAQVDRLLDYLALLQRWNAIYNLTAVREPAAMLDLHLADCLAIVPALRRFAADRPITVLDVGSGAGLPGLVIAVMQPAWSVTCIDAVAKKAGFVRQAAAELGLTNLQSRHGRVEAMAGGPGFDLIVSRAFASLHDFAAWTEGALAPDGVWAAMKAELSERERTGLPRGIDVFHVEPISVPGLAARRCLVWMRRRRD